jgi:predicted ATPase
MIGDQTKKLKDPKNMVVLTPSNWDDYSYKTSFGVSFYDSQSLRSDLGNIKVGYKGQAAGWTRDAMKETFVSLPDGWFSLGQDVEYYKSATKLPTTIREQILGALKDVVADESALIAAQDEVVYSTSLTRSVGLSSINGQFRRVLKGEVELTNFSFSFKQEGDAHRAKIELDFQVEAASKPSTNVHVLIGRNGVGKTTILNHMVGALLGVMPEDGLKHRFTEPGFLGDEDPLSRDYFSSLVSVSFSAFDPFLPPKDRPDRRLGLAYFYIGMKNARLGHSLEELPPPKTDIGLVADFVASFSSCISQTAKRERWLNAIKRLESDSNFADMDLGQLLKLPEGESIDRARKLAIQMSSGHSIVLLTVTKLVDTVEEKTLVLLDEPESHLHPPLLSAFTRALSDLLHSRNGVAIIATHSPVVLQEVPRSCVWILSRARAEARSDRPERETFGENVGILTREVFGLEVAKSGFHELMQEAVDSGQSYDQISRSFQNQLGGEAKAVLLSLIAARSSAGDEMQ